MTVRVYTIHLCVMAIPIVLMTRMKQIVSISVLIAHTTVCLTVITETSALARLNTFSVYQEVVYLYRF